jgi:hypothetical protein
MEASGEEGRTMMMATRATQVLQQLRSGSTLSKGGAEVVLPGGLLAVRVLDELVRRYEANETGASAEDASALLKAVAASPAGVQKAVADAVVEAADKAAEGDAPRWRLHRLTAHNYRGLTEWDGDDFTYDFAGKPHHIYGLNGSGKTGILSAIVWCLTGCCLRERDQPQDEVRAVALYESQCERACVDDKWPEVVTVPHNIAVADVAGLEPNCWVQVELRSGDRKLLVRRRLVGRQTQSDLEVVEGDVQHQSLADVGITDTCMEFTLLMPGRVSSMQFAKGSKFSGNLLAVSGLSALTDLAGLSKGLQRSVRTLENQWRGKAEEALRQATEAADEAASAEAVPEGVAEMLEEVSGAHPMADGERQATRLHGLYAAQAAALRAMAAEGFARLQDAIFEPPLEGSEREELQEGQRENIVEDLQRARHLLDQEDAGPDTWEPLLSWRQLAGDPTECLAAVDNAAEGTRRALTGRYELWRRNVEELGRLDLMIHAAHYLKEIERYEDCPVCEQGLPEPVKHELVELASEVRAGEEALLIWVGEKETELEGCLPADIRAIEDERPDEQIRGLLEKHVLAPFARLGALKDRAAGDIGGLVEGLAPFEPPATEAALAHEDWDEQFPNLVRPLEEKYQDLRQRCYVARWVQEHGAEAETQVSELVTATVDSLRKLEAYGDQYSELMKLATALAAASVRCQEAGVLEEQAAHAGQVHLVLAEFSKLDGYAKACLDEDVEALAGKMQQFYRMLYPNDEIAMAGLVNCETTKGAKPDYRCQLKWADGLLADADAISNGGRIRGLLWSYVFALIGAHDLGLEVIVADDPYASLDDYAGRNMMTELMVNCLGDRYQVLATTTDPSLVEPMSLRDPDQERFATASVLSRPTGCRTCRIKTSSDPLREAMWVYEQDPNQWADVVREARVYLEGSLKLLAEFWLAADCRNWNYGQLVPALRDAADSGTGTTPLGTRMASRIRHVVAGVEGVPRAILHFLHHGGPDRSKASTAHAEYVAEEHPKWARTFEEAFRDVDATLARASLAPVANAAEYPLPGESDVPLLVVAFPQAAREIGRVAAEGAVSLMEQDDAEVVEHVWPKLGFAVVASDACSPVVLPGQIAVLALSGEVHDGDLALMGSGDGWRLLRVFRAELGGEDEPGWVGQSVNPLVRNVPPVVRSYRDAIVRKLVGVLYSDGTGYAPADVPVTTDVVQVESFPDVMQKLHGGKLALLGVVGDSAEPVALGGQIVIVEQMPPDLVNDNSLCCAVLSDGTTVLKRLTRYGGHTDRVLLQPINQQSGYQVIEAALGPASESADTGPEGLPYIVDVRVVRGVLFGPPELLDD